VSYKEFYGSNFLNAADLEGGPLETTIEDIRVQEVVGRSNQKKTRVILVLEGAKKPLILNSTNASTMGKAFGEDYLKWGRKRIRLESQTVNFQGEEVKGIRLSIPPRKK
jgi:hypothetical protein